MDDRLAKNLRTGMLVASVTVVILAVGIILLAMMTPGNWVEVHESEPIAIGINGTNVRVTGTVRWIPTCHMRWRMWMYLW